MKNESGKTDKGETSGWMAHARSALQTRLGVLRQSRRGRMFDAPEMLAMAASFALLGVAILAYFSLLAPARARLDNQQRELQQVQKRLRNSTAANAGGAQVTAADIINSVQNFEADHLTLQSEGRTAVIRELNELIRRNGLRPTAVMSFTPLDPLQLSSASAGMRATGNTKQSVFPGTGIGLTVEGQYPNLRRFIRDIEVGRQFVVINGVELEGVT
ncbi:MAG: hypothetical protein H0T92_08095, partial [Pyrinomonadaceae bacterium]|nr:hypothetical protein [Pyrinomonadaceae bacterium]